MPILCHIQVKYNSYTPSHEILYGTYDHVTLYWVVRLSASDHGVILPLKPL
jgi:hypothetical protein